MQLSNVVSAAALAGVASAAANAQEVAFFTALVGDYQANKLQYIQYIATANDVPGAVSSLAMQVRTYSADDTSYTTLLNDGNIDIPALESFATNVPWYSRIVSDAGATLGGASATGSGSGSGSAAATASASGSGSAAASATSAVASATSKGASSAASATGSAGSALSSAAGSITSGAKSATSSGAKASSAASSHGSSSAAASSSSSSKGAAAVKYGSVGAVLAGAAIALL
ncbi:repressed By RIM101 protein 2 [[Candida] anglica]|uniref:Repressed By RIM101 protein 2 n=1 Tax=[Candida] anglica TaxID=148631 RepID=A0ABP0EP29_9ASCO